MLKVIVEKLGDAGWTVELSSSDEWLTVLQNKHYGENTYKTPVEVMDALAEIFEYD